MDTTQTHGLIRVSSRDPEIDAVLRKDHGSGVEYTRHFNQGEDFFLKLSRPLEVPAFAIHHDIRKPTPSSQYYRSLQELVHRVIELVPGVLGGLNYMFDPAEILRPAFYRLYRWEDRYYLYQLRLDIIFRPQLHQVVVRGTNDTTPVYRSDHLILDANVIPLSGIEGTADEPAAFHVEELISETWIGETGRGYFIQGIWIDSDLTKFFSKLMIPRGKRIYPYYPFNSKFRTVCLAPHDPEVERCGSMVPVLHRTRSFLAPYLESIQQVLREKEFNEALPLFEEIKSAVPRDLEAVWEPISMNVYLNSDDMKEFQVVVGEER